MQNIRGILRNVISQEGMERKLDECEALLVWDDVAPTLAARTQPVAISRGRMVINVTDSVMLHQLTFYKKEYIDKINLLLGRRIVRDITFRVGNVERRGQGTESRDEYIERLHSVELDQDEITKIDELTDQIEDEEVRDSLKELFTSQAQLSKIRDSES
jgi:hypothetical protein